MQGKTGALIGLFLSFVLIATALSSITLVKPVADEHIRGTYTLTATTGTAMDYVEFWFWTYEIPWTLIGTNSTPGTSFSMTVDTTLGNDMDGVLVKVNTSNASGSFSDQKGGIVIDNTKPVISNVSNSTPLEWQITIIWNTNEEANSIVEYANTTAAVSSDAALKTSHSITLTSLLENTHYQFNVTSCDKAGNCEKSASHSFTTASKPPIITNVKTETVHSNYAVISWNTNEEANSTVNYGKTEALGNYASNSSMSTNRNMTLTGLENGTLYYYNVSSCDAAHNCNTTGPLSFTTLVDTTPPTVDNTLINMSTTMIVHLGEKINITASAWDNTQISSAWVKFNYLDGSSETKAMTAISGSGTVSDPYLYSLIHTASRGGKQNVTVHAKDVHNNEANGETLNLTVYGYFTITADIPSTFKNFSFGTTHQYTITVNNDNNITENYALSTNITNIPGWSVQQSASSLTGINSLESGNIIITVTVPLNASENVDILTFVNSSSGHNSSKTIRFSPPSISVKLHDQRHVSNNSNWTDSIYSMKSITAGGPLVKVINITGVGTVTSEVDGNITSVSTVSCGLYQNSSLKYSGVVNITAQTCWFNAATFAAGIYDLNLSAVHSTRKHKGFNTAKMIIPDSLSINTNSLSAEKSKAFTVRGNAEYEEGFPASFILISANYSGNVIPCNGTTDYRGDFSFTCFAPSSTGTYTMTVNSSDGVWGISGSSTATLSVADSVNATAPSQNVVISTSVSSIVLDSEKTIKVSVLNNRTTTQDFELSVSHGDFIRFGTEYNSSLNVPAKQTAELDLKLTPVEMAKPGTYTLTISIPAENVQKTVAVTVPEPALAENAVNVNRFKEERKDNSSSTVIIRVLNSKNNTVQVSITETIPKEVAESASLISFSPQPEILEDNPVVLWNIELSPGESKELKYTVNKTLGNASFITPSTGVVDVFEEQEKIDVEKVETGSRIIYILIIVIATAAAIAFLIYKDDIIKRKKLKLVKPSDIIKRKDAEFESPYPGRKLDEFGENSNKDKLGSLFEKKKEEGTLDFKK